MLGANLLLQFAQELVLYSMLSPLWKEQTHWEAGKIEVTKEKFKATS